MTSRGTAAARYVRRGAPLSQIELVTVVVAIVILIGVAVSRLAALAAFAERVSMDSTLGALREAIGIEVASDVAKDDLKALDRLDGANPMELLARKPANYVGDRTGPAQVLPGQWYFNKGRHELVYRVRWQRSFVAGVPGPPRARFVVRAVREREGGQLLVVGLNLVAVEPYRWRR